MELEYCYSEYCFNCDSEDVSHVLTSPVSTFPTFIGLCDLCHDCELENIKERIAEEIWKLEITKRVIND